MLDWLVAVLGQGISTMQDELLFKGGVMSKDSEAVDNQLLSEADEEQSEHHNGSKKRKPKTTPRQFPINALEEAIRIAQIIRDCNGGNPWAPGEIAKVLKMGERSNNLFYLTASSRDYGLTVGTNRAGKIELTNLGKQIVYPTSPEAEVDALKKAFFNVDLFKAVYDHYSCGQLPEIKYLKNTLITEFSVAEEHINDFYNVFQKNMSCISKSEIISSEVILAKKDTQEQASPIILGEPENNTTLRTFIVMPFSEKTDLYPKGFFDEVLRSLITPAAVSAGFKVETARRDGSDLIHSTIVNDLSDADLVIVDLTEHNPNVLFELGMRIAFEKPVALIHAIGTPSIFDVDNLLRVYAYDSRLWKTTLEQDLPKLTKHIKGAWDARKSSMTYLQLLRNK
ncbi:hypothetical protein LLG46_06060 [bacterium]|nr:hypothetical protein [bacterium]